MSDVTTNDREATGASTTDLTELAQRIVDAMGDAANRRSRRYTVVYSARPLDDEEMELVKDYLRDHLDVYDSHTYEEPFDARVRIVVDGKVLEGDLEIGDEPIIENVIDESLIMGIKIVRGDTVIDGSLKYRLEKLRHSLHQHK